MTGLVHRLQSAVAASSTAFQNALHNFFPSEKREEMYSKMQNFAINNPKLAAFLVAQLLFTGLPLLLFLTFTITVFLFSLITALLVGLILASLFTASMVGVALIIVLPTVFLTTFGATFVFLWGLGCYSILQWLNEREHPSFNGTVLGDKINSLTGGHMRKLLDSARSNRKTGDDREPKACNAEKDGIEDNTTGKNTSASSSISNEKPRMEDFSAKHTETVKGQWLNTDEYEHVAAEGGIKSAQVKNGTAHKGASDSLGPN